MAAPWLSAWCDQSGTEQPQLGYREAELNSDDARDLICAKLATLHQSQPAMAGTL
jgi:hypothetical protein